MRILRHHRNAPDWAKGAVIALGNFDGVHRGHRALINHAGQIAEAENCPLAAMVFEPYPREFFQQNTEPFRLTSFRAKAELLKSAGVDLLFVIHFDAEIAGRLAQDFVADVIVSEFAAAHVVVGEDFRFGKGRGGDAAVLAYMGQVEGFGVTLFGPIVDGGQKISSTNVRAALKAGTPEQAARLLGHWWTIEGHVAHGDARGRLLGFPTANLHMEPNLLRPRYGVYAVRARRGSYLHPGVANFGIRPMFAVATPLLETFIFDFSGALYGELLQVQLIRHLRDEIHFDDVQALTKQMHIDCACAQQALATVIEPAS